MIFARGVSFIHEHYNMKISRLMGPSQHVEKVRDKRKTRDAKRARCFDGDFSKGRLEIQNNPSFKKRVSNKFRYKFPMSRDDKVYNSQTK